MDKVKMFKRVVKKLHLLIVREIKSALRYAEIPTRAIVVSEPTIEIEADEIYCEIEFSSGSETIIDKLRDDGSVDLNRILIEAVVEACEEFAMNYEAWAGPLDYESEDFLEEIMGNFLDSANSDWYSGMNLYGGGMRSVDYGVFTFGVELE